MAALYLQRSKNDAEENDDGEAAGDGERRDGVEGRGPSTVRLRRQRVLQRRTDARVTQSLGELLLRLRATFPSRRPTVAFSCNQQKNFVFLFLLLSSQHRRGL